MQHILQNQSSLFGIYQSLFEFNLNISYAIDPEGFFVLVNDTMVELTGYSREEFRKLSFVSILHKDDIESTLNCFQEIMAGKRKDFDVTILTKANKPIELYVTASPIVIDGEVKGVAGVARDMTEKNAMEAELKESKNQLQNIFNSIDICLWSLNADASAFLQISSACKKIFGYSRDEILANSKLWRTDIHPHDVEEIARKKQELLAGQPFSMEFRVIKPEEDIKWVYLNALPVFDEQGEIIRFDGLMYDISQRRQAEEALHHLAFHDPLTDLPNRRNFELKLADSLDLAKKSHTKTAVLYLDLDSFKMINDTLGHRVGDQLLKIIALRLTECLRKDDLISRQGGDEFAIILNNIGDMGEIHTVAEKILEAVTKPISLEENEYSFTISMGISVFPDHAEQTEEMIKKADQAMYLAKEGGKNNYSFYHRGMTDCLSRKVQLIQDLRHAIQNDELMLHYQPIINLKNKNAGITGFEALLRWNHPALGIISPEEFIPLAEESGLILPLGEWVVRKACSAGAKWQKNDFPNAYVSVNISPRQLDDPYFVDKVKAIINETDFNPCDLKMEVTESVMMKSIEETVLKLQSLVKTGIEFFLDDFGKGYSSLSYLEQLPISTLKIDKSFVQDISKRPNQETIIRTITGMAANLEMAIIAEGVEEEDQLQFLESINCSYMQGYLFSKPVPFGAINSVLQKELLDSAYNVFH